MFASMGEGIFQCEGCGCIFPEYVNGCPHCWDDDLSVEANRVRFPARAVRLVVPDIGCEHHR